MNVPDSSDTFTKSKIIPLKGLGTYNINDEVFDQVIENALEIGYRHFDTASYYKNEKKLGNILNKLVSEKRVSRDELFIVTKIWNDEKEDVETALRKSLNNLGMTYVDLYLIHWPMGYYDQDKNLKLTPLHVTWKQMEDCVKKGLTRLIGVSNFNVQLLLDLLSYAEIKPAANQIELHPYLSQENLVNFCQKNGCEIISYGSLTRGKINYSEDENLKSLGNKYKRTPSEIVLNWLNNRKIIVIPKTSNYERLKENFHFDDFKMEDIDYEKIDKINKNLRVNNRIVDQDFKIPLFD